MGGTHLSGNIGLRKHDCIVGVDIIFSSILAILWSIGQKFAACAEFRSRVAATERRGAS